jgi:hypothetical protein
MTTLAGPSLSSRTGMEKLTISSLRRSSLEQRKVAAPARAIAVGLPCMSFPVVMQCRWPCQNAKAIKETVEELQEKTFKVLELDLSGLATIRPVKLRWLITVPIFAKEVLVVPSSFRPARRSLLGDFYPTAAASIIARPLGYGHLILGRQNKPRSGWL